MHTDRTNRLLLGIVGFLAFAIGTAGLLAAGGIFTESFAHRRLADNRVWRYFSDQGDWLWPTIAAVAFVVMLLGVIWLLRLLFATDRTAEITIRSRARIGPAGDRPEADTVTTPGGTTLRASALTSALVAEIQSYHGVTAARARVLGDPVDPTLALDVTVSRRADVPALVERVEREAIGHARAALQRTALPVQLDIAVTDRGVPRPA